MIFLNYTKHIHVTFYHTTYIYCGLEHAMHGRSEYLLALNTFIAVAQKAMVTQLSCDEITGTCAIPGGNIFHYLAKLLSDFKNLICLTCLLIHNLAFTSITHIYMNAVFIPIKKRSALIRGLCLVC